MILIFPLSNFKLIFRLISLIAPNNLTPSQLATAIGLTPEMIAEGTTILGITGNYTGTGKLTEEEYNEIEALADSVLAKAN